MFEAREKKMTEALQKILTADQMTRLKEISIQLAGKQAVNDADVQTKLSITDDQKAKLKTLSGKMQEANRSIFEKMRDGEIQREDVQGMMKQNQTIMGTEIDKILTDDQKAKLKALAGKPFKATDQPRGFGGGK